MKSVLFRLLPAKQTFATAKRTIRAFGSELIDQRGLILAGIVTSLSSTAFELLRPWPIKLVVDRLVKAKKRFPIDYFNHVSIEQLLTWACIGLVLIPCCIGFFGMLSKIAFAQVGRKLTTRVRRRVCEHLQLLPLSFHQRSETGDLLVRLMGDVNMVRDILFTGWVTLIDRTLLFLCTLGLVTWIAPPLALVTLLPLPLLAVSMERSGSRMKSAVREQRKKEGSAASMAIELLRHARLVKAFGAERRTTKIFAGISRSGERAGVVATRIASLAGLQAEIITGAGLAAVLWFGSMRVVDGRLSPGDLLLLVSYARALYKPLRTFASESVKLSKAAACAERIFDVFDQEPEDTRRGDPAPALVGAVRFEEVGFAYPSGRPALRGLSFEVPPGTLTVLRGPNGSGKSTTLGLLLRLFDPASGRILLDGRDSRDFSIESLRERFACVPQDDLLFSGSIRDNILFGRPDATDAQVTRAAADAYVLDFAEKFPEGLDTLVGEGGSRLSGGQKRRISLARAAVRDASILLLDEPLEGLDPRARTDVARGIRGIASGRTTIVVSHTSVDDVAPDMVIDIKEGRLAGVTR